MSKIREEEETVSKNGEECKVWSGKRVTEGLGLEVSNRDEVEKYLGMAYRDNPKRAHLLVSKVLGKHIPQRPLVVTYDGLGLAKKVTDIRSLRKADFVVFGYAETAVALGGLVAQGLGAFYFHSTRYPLLEGTTPYSDFSEEHSHASSHTVRIKYPKALTDPAKVMVLVDDELTTGKTVVNTIRAFEEQVHRKRYVVATLTDARTPEAEAAMREAAREMKTSIEVVSLLKTVVNVPSDALEKAPALIKDLLEEGAGVEATSLKNETESKTHELSKIELNIELPNFSSGAFFGDFELLEESLGDTAEKLSGFGGKALVLGVEEDMIPPLTLATLLEEAGEDVWFSTTTQSPVHPFPSDDYAIKTDIPYSVSSDDTVRHCYNVDDSYDRIILLSRSAEETASLSDLLNKLRRLSEVVVIENAFPSPLSAPEFGSYSEDDVLWLLKDLSEYELEGSVEDREAKIQSGEEHYSESLPKEYVPTEAYQKLFHESLKDEGERLAEAVALVSERVLKARDDNPVLVSLARAGVPIGVLMKRYIERVYGNKVPHYAISIIRGKGIDKNALSYILKEHSPESIIFVDGWTGKGAITRQLSTALEEFKNETGVSISSELAVLADPGHCVSIYGTREDYLIPSACLNSTVSGLVSRTVLNDSIIGSEDFHGAKFYKEFTANDVSNLYLDEVSKYFTEELAEKGRELAAAPTDAPDWSGWREIEKIAEEFGMGSVNLVKPGVGETTRVLLRRVPWKILVNPEHKKDLKHIFMLAEERGVEIVEREGLTYSAVGLIHPKFSKSAE